MHRYSFVPLQSIMETIDNSIELKITEVLSDIRQKGYSSVQPFTIGKVEDRMTVFANNHAVILASDELYISAKQLQHCMRASKGAKGLEVDDADLVGFPKNRFQMYLYYDGVIVTGTGAWVWLRCLSPRLL